MKRLWNKLKYPLGLFFLWRTALFFIQLIAPLVWPLREGFLGPSPWANLDGVHYLSIAEHGYFQFEQTFFPLYPLFIKWLSRVQFFTPLSSGLFISNVSFIVVLVVTFKLIKLEKLKNANWILMFLLLVPTSFFFAAFYTESLFLALALITVYAARKQWWWLAGVAGLLASATRLFGVLLLIIVAGEYFLRKYKRIDWNVLFLFLIPLGLLAYMYYLFRSVGDPLAFFHFQPAFGANRSGSALIFLPQVLWRYFKIFQTVTPKDLSLYVAIFEFLTFIGSLWLIYLGYKQKIKIYYLIYSFLVITLPSLTGTLSSLPRYFLEAFPLIFVLGSLRSGTVKVFLLIVFALGLVICTTAFLQGYFIA